MLRRKLDIEEHGVGRSRRARARRPKATTSELTGAMQRVHAELAQLPRIEDQKRVIRAVQELLKHSR